MNVSGARQALNKPVKFGKYYLLERINVGGMAEVFKAKSFGVEGFEKLVAIKRILSAIAEDEDFIAMFIDEAKIAVQLNHANIAQIYDLGKIEESYFIALEYVHGKDMRTIWERHKKKGIRLPIPLAVYVVGRICEGLDYAHRKKNASGMDLNIVHRDVSPQNILVSYEGEVKIVDFGIAKAANKASRTQAGILKGKFGYMSPEQVRGLPLDRRSDIFSAGIILYECLTGERLFVGESDFSVLEKVRSVDILPPTTYNRKIPDSLEKIVLKALSKDPDDRYRSAYDMQEDLQRFLIETRTNFSRKDLAGYMKRAFTIDIEREAERHKQFEEAMSVVGDDDTVTEAPEPVRPLSVPPPIPREVPPSPLPQKESIDESIAESIQDLIETGEDEGEDDEIQTVVVNARAVSPEAFNPEITPVSEPPMPVPTSALPTDPGRHPPAPLPPQEVLDTGAEVDEMITSRQSVQEALAAEKGEEGVVLPQEEFPSGESTLSEERTLEKRSRLRMIIALLAVAVICTFSYAVYRYMKKQGHLSGSTTLVLQVTPADAVVQLDGKPVTSPIEGVKPGSHRIAVSAKGREPFVQDIQVQAIDRQTIIVNVPSALALVDITVEPPDARVLFDGKPAGDKSPIQIRDVTPGVLHELSLEHPKYETKVEKFKVEPRENKKLLIALNEKHFNVNVESDPDGSRILLDDKPAGRTPMTLPNLRATKEYQLSIRRPRYETWKGTVFYDGTNVKEIRVRLEPVARSSQKPSSDKPPRTGKGEPKEKPPAKEEPQEAPPEPPEPAPAEDTTEPETIQQPEAEPEPAPAVETKKADTDGFLRLNSKPWGKVLINGEDIKKNTPLVDYQLKAGKYKITVEYSTGGSKSDEVEIRPGETTTKLFMD